MIEQQILPALVTHVNAPFLGFDAGEIITRSKSGHRYTVGAVIGEGNFGIVNECVDEWGNRLVIKSLKAGRGIDLSLLRFSADREFGKLQYLRHPHITYVYDQFEVDGICCIVTERCAYPIRNMFFKEFDGRYWIRPIARCVLQAIEFMHKFGMVHKDLHLENVFANFQRDELLPDNQAMNFKVGDLGIDNFVEDMVPETTTLAQWMLPPEAIDPDEFGRLDPRVDIYHAGLLLLQIMLGMPVNFSREEIMDGIPRDMALRLDHPYSSALEKALRRHVDMRTGSARELWHDLNT